MSRRTIVVGVFVITLALQRVKLSMNYLIGSIYHMVHFDNLFSIFVRGGLLSRDKLLGEGRTYHSIANDEVQGLRDRILILDIISNRFRSLHNYVPFYFSTRTSMLRAQTWEGLQDRIIFFEVDRSIMREKGVLFTDGNASNQQLTRSGIEKVQIIPVALLKSSCSRVYMPADSFRGSNTHCSDFYRNTVFLNRLNWDIINSKRSFTGEKRQQKQAEVLVPDFLPVHKIRNIYVNNQTMVQDVNTLIVQCKLRGRIPSAVYRPELFFNS